MAQHHTAKPRFEGPTLSRSVLLFYPRVSCYPSLLFHFPFLSFSAFLLPPVPLCTPAQHLAAWASTLAPLEAPTEALAVSALPWAVGSCHASWGLCHQQASPASWSAALHPRAQPADLGLPLTPLPNSLLSPTDPQSPTNPPRLAHT